MNQKLINGLNYTFWGIYLRVSKVHVSFLVSKNICYTEKAKQKPKKRILVIVGSKNSFQIILNLPLEVAFKFSSEVIGEFIANSSLTMLDKGFYSANHIVCTPLCEIRFTWGSVTKHLLSKKWWAFLNFKVRSH